MSVLAEVSKLGKYENYGSSKCLNMSIRVLEYTFECLNPRNTQGIGLCKFESSNGLLEPSNMPIRALKWVIGALESKQKGILRIRYFRF